MRSLPSLLAVLMLVASSEALAKQEAWYWGFGLGYAKTSYPNFFQRQVDSINGMSGMGHSSRGLDVAFWWPVGAGDTLLGASITGMSDSWTAGSANASLAQSGLYFTATHTFGAPAMEGFFLRGDLGFARVAATTSTSDVTAAVNEGLGANAGIGYGLSLSDETRLVFQGIFSYRNVESNSYTSWSILVGPVF